VGPAARSTASTVATARILLRIPEPYVLVRLTTPLRQLQASMRGCVS
jgi:hypothetical protein